MHYIYYCLNGDCRVIKYQVNPSKFPQPSWAKSNAFQCPACGTTGTDSGDI